ncbi:MAG: hypothetical protein WAW52_15335 [Methanothrix sp.]
MFAANCLYLSLFDRPAINSHVVRGESVLVPVVSVSHIYMPGLRAELLQ